MPHRWWMVLAGSVAAFCLLAVGPVWAIPKHDIDVAWGKDSLHAKQGYGEEKKYGHEKYAKKDYEKWPDGKDKWGDFEKKYKDHDEKKWGHGYGKYDDWKDPDCDPPVPTPEPATMLLLGSTLTAAGLYARRRRRP